MTRLAAVEGFSFSPRIPARGATTEATWDGFYEQLTAEDLTRRLVASTPERVRSALLFLDVSLMEWSPSAAYAGVADRPRDWPGLLGLLARILRSELPPEDARLEDFAFPWPMRRIGPIGKGANIVEPELLELTSRFRSVENADPLAGSRVEDFAAPWPWPPPD